MSQCDMLVLKGDEILSLLRDRELELIDVVRTAYLAHARDESMLPHSVFLRFPQDARNRIIALPAYLGAEFRTAGIKWIASFPENLASGIDRASAVMILNSVETGRPIALLEGSIISAKRTAASAVLAARYLQAGSPAAVGLIGCGLINFEIVRFLLLVFPEIKEVFIFDQILENALRFKDKVRELSERVSVELVPDISAVFRNSSLVSFATTAGTPHIKDFSGLATGSTILHISLRDLVPELILSCDNVVDDIDHVCRAQTSLHLAEQIAGDRRFIRCTLADVLEGKAAARAASETTTVFSPFGLGILDLAIARFAYERAAQAGLGAVIESFLPDPWFERAG
jgi:N-[(2S)-2-amino-2-carboxyethyl]-L-glutamate dehydrogenase